MNLLCLSWQTHKTVMSVQHSSKDTFTEGTEKQYCSFDMSLKNFIIKKIAF